MNLEKAKKTLEKFTRIHKSGCHIWTGSLDHSGYGKYTQHMPVDKGRKDIKRHASGNPKYKHHHLSAHRTSYIINKGAIDDGMTIHHTCNVPFCVNPDHLEQISNKDNVSQQDRAKIGISQECAHGNKNDYYYMSSSGVRRRVCRICRKEYKQYMRVKMRNKRNAMLETTRP